MDKIRQGNAISLSLSVKVNNTYIDWDDVVITSFEVQLAKKYSAVRLSGTRTESGTVINYAIPAEQTLKQAGIYRAVVAYRYEGNDYAVDAELFELVETTEEATLSPDQSEVVEVVRVESTIEADVIFAAVAAAGQAEAAAEEGEASRNQAESARASAEQTRQTNETSRGEAESARASAEQTRQTNETSRDEAESARASAEQTRQTNETSRDEAESARASAEQTRQTNETSRTEAEAARASAEQTRQTNETSRTEAEAARTLAEQTRQSNETSRTEAETARASAEQTRQTNETERQTDTAAAITNANTATNNANTAAAAADEARENIQSDLAAKADKDGNELNTIAEAECSADERLARLENFVRKLVKGDVICDKITTRELNLQGTTSLVRQGAGAPTTAPDYIGQLYVNTTNGDYYKSTGNESVSNWVIL